MDQIDGLQDLEINTDEQEQPLDNRKQITEETSDLETKKREKKTRPRMADADKGIKRLKVKFRGKKYDTQFTNTGRKYI